MPKTTVAGGASYEGDHKTSAELAEIAEREGVDVAQVNPDGSVRTEDNDKPEDGEQSSDGSSSQTSPGKRASLPKRSESTLRPPARSAENPSAPDQKDSPGFGSASSTDGSTRATRR